MADVNIERRKDGENVKCLIGTFRITQSKVAKDMGIPDSTLSEMLSQEVIDDENLEKIAASLGHGMTAEAIKNYDHDMTKAFVINHVYSGGKNFNAGSNDRSENKNVINELDFIKEYGRTKEQLMYFRMMVEPDKVKGEMEGEDR